MSSSPPLHASAGVAGRKRSPLPFFRLPLFSLSIPIFLHFSSLLILPLVVPSPTFSLSRDGLLSFIKSFHHFLSCGGINFHRTSASPSSFFFTSPSSSLSPSSAPSPPFLVPQFYVRGREISSPSLPLTFPTLFLHHFAIAPLDVRLQCPSLLHFYTTLPCFFLSIILIATTTSHTRTFCYRERGEKRE